MPPPVKVTLPPIVRSVKLPVELIVMEPLLVIVPTKVVVELLLAIKVPVIVRVVRVAVFRLRMMPVPVVLRMPPVTLAPLMSWTCEPSSASIVPALLSKAPAAVAVQEQDAAVARRA